MIEEDLRLDISQNGGQSDTSLAELLIRAGFVVNAMLRHHIFAGHCLSTHNILSSRPMSATPIIMLFFC